MLLQPLWRTVWRFLKKLKIELPYDPAIPLLGMCPEKNMVRKDTCTPIVCFVMTEAGKDEMETHTGEKATWRWRWRFHRALPRPVHWFAKAAITKQPRLSGLNNRNVLSHSSGGWKSNMKLPAGVGSFRAGL